MRVDETAVSIPVDEQVCFTDHEGRPKRGAEKRAKKLLAKVEPLLQRLLEPDEKVLYITTACSPYSALEFLTTGWMIVHLKRCLVVFTDLRMLHLPTQNNYSPRLSVAQARYGDMASAKVGSVLGCKLSLTYENRQKEQFTALTRAAAKKLRTFLPRWVGKGGKTSAGSRHHICPQCSRALEDDVFTCPGCNLEFKSRRRALLFSILLPGGGYFYTGHPVIGSMDAVVEGLFLLMIASGAALAVTGEDPEAWPMVAVFALFLAVEKLITVYHAGHYVKEFLPLDKRLDLRRP